MSLNVAAALVAGASEASVGPTGAAAFMLGRSRAKTQADRLAVVYVSPVLTSTIEWYNK